MSRNTMTIPILSGRPAIVRDADGSLVRIALSGPGQGLLRVTNLHGMGGQLDSLILNGTNSRTSLSITSTGGMIPGTTINTLDFNKASRAQAALGLLDAPGLDLAAGGLLEADGNVGAIRVHHLGPDAEVSVAGSLGTFSAQAMRKNAELLVSGSLSQFQAMRMAPGANVSVVNQIGSLKVARDITNAQILVGTGGLTSMTAGTIRNSIIYSVGAIGNVTVGGDVVGAKLISNVLPGSDGVYGTKDDLSGNDDVLSQGGINSLTVGGNLTGSVLVSVGSIGNVTVGKQNAPANMTSTLVIANVTPGADEKFGTLDDIAHDPGVTHNIAAVTVFGIAQNNVIAANGLVAKAVTVAGAAGNVRVAADETPVHTSGNNTVVAGIGATIPLHVVLDPNVVRAFTASQIFVDVYGFLNKPGEIIANPDTWYLTPTGFERTVNLPPPSASTPNHVMLPSYSLDQFPSTAANTWTLSLPVSGAAGQAFSGRILISAGIPVQAQVNPIDHTVSAPSTANPTDPATGSYTEFLEFTVNPPNYPELPELYIDTSQVDWFSIPLTLQVDGTKDSVGNTLGPVGVIQPRATVAALGMSDTANLNNYQNFINHSGQINHRAYAFAAAYTTEAAGVTGGVVIATTAASPIVVSTNNVAGLKTGDHVIVMGVVGHANANGTWKVGAITKHPTGANDGVIAGTFELLNLDGTPTHGTDATTAGGTWYLADSTPIRLVAPKDITAGLRDNPIGSQAQVVDPLNTYFNQTIDQLFLKYFTGTINTPLRVTVTDGGTGYTSPPTVTFNGGGGTGAAGTAIIKDGKVTGVIITNEGSGYTSAPTVAFDGGGGSGASATAENTMTGGGHTLQLSQENKLLNGTVQMAGSNYVFRFVEAGGGSQSYDIYYPFFTTNLPTPNTQASDQNTGSNGTYTPLFTPGPVPRFLERYQHESPSQMIFACDGVFADSALRPGIDETTKAIIGNLENQISAAINRGVALDAPATGATAFWQNPANWFKQSSGQQGVYNYWVEFFHQESLVAANDNPINYPLAYAFAFDDQGNASSTIHGLQVKSATITLGSWSSTATRATMTTLSDITLTQKNTGQPPGAGPFTLNVKATVAPVANGGGTPTGTVTFFVNGVPLSETTDGEVPKPAPRPITLQADGTAVFNGTLPALPQMEGTGTAVYTFAITAVYSGDGDHLTSVGLGSVARPDPAGNPVNSTGLSLYSATEGKSLQVTATATVGTSSATPPSGTVSFELLDSAGTKIADLAKNVPVANYVAATVFDPSNIPSLSGSPGPLQRGTYTVRSVHSGGGTSSATFTVKAALVATQLTFDPQPPATVAAGKQFTVTVNLENKSGEVLPIFGGEVTLTAGNPGTPAFTRKAPVVNGQATFNLTFAQPGTGYALKASFSSTDNGNPPDQTSNAFDVLALGKLTSTLTDSTSGGAATATVELTPGFNPPSTPFFVQIGETYQFVVGIAADTWTFLFKIGPTGQTHAADTPITLAAGVAGLHEGVDAATTQIKLNDGFNSSIQGFPAPGHEPFFIQIDQEIMKVTKLDEAAALFTVLRGQNGTSAAAHSSGAIITLLS